MKLKITFESFSDANLCDLHDADGVYVISSETDLLYIGSGKILSRLGAHNSKYYPPWNGCYCILNTEGKSSNQNKGYSEFLEYVLLWALEEEENYPIDNKKRSYMKIDNLVIKHGKIELEIFGRNPTIPGHPRLKTPISLFVERDRNGVFVLSNLHRLVA